MKIIKIKRYRFSFTENRFLSAMIYRIVQTKIKIDYIRVFYLPDFSSKTVANKWCVVCLYLFFLLVTRLIIIDTRIINVAHTVINLNYNNVLSNTWVEKSRA